MKQGKQRGLDVPLPLGQEVIQVEQRGAGGGGSNASAVVVMAAARLLFERYVLRSMAAPP
jgi:hypothetical protein